MLELQLRGFGDVCCIPENRLTETLVPGKNNQGRPSEPWCDWIREEAEKKGLAWMVDSTPFVLLTKT